MNPVDRSAKIYECRGQILVTLNLYNMDIGIEAMISLLAGACAAVELRKQQPLLQQITKEIRSQYKGVARVQHHQDSNARRAAALEGAGSGQPQVQSGGTGTGKSSGGGDPEGPESGSGRND